MKLCRINFTLFILIFSSIANAYDPVDCMKEVANNDQGIVVGLATRLCSAAWSLEPVRCYVAVSKFDKSIPRGIAIDLCAGAIDADKTIACYARASEENLNRGLATTLCGARKQEK